MQPSARKKNKQTKTLERTKVAFPLWRKKIDNSIFRDAGTTIPNWVCKLWKFDEVFPGILSSKDSKTQVSVVFDGITYKGRVVSTHPKVRANRVYRFFFDDELLARLKETFLMSHMRDLESRLRDDSADIETQIPFWEFLDMEFDHKRKRFFLTAHYKQIPTFPALLKNLIGSPAIKRLEEHVTHPDHFRIQKQDWRPRVMYETELGASNVIYTLIDTRAKLVYIGEAGDLIRRFKAGHSEIKDWDFYRYDQLPPVSKNLRVALERMIIRLLASLLENNAGILTKSISGYRLANRKVDA